MDRQVWGKWCLKNEEISANCGLNYKVYIE